MVRKLDAVARREPGLPAERIPRERGGRQPAAGGHGRGMPDARADLHRRTRRSARIALDL